MSPFQESELRLIRLLLGTAIEDFVTTVTEEDFAETDVALRADNALSVVWFLKKQVLEEARHRQGATA